MSNFGEQPFNEYEEPLNPTPHVCETVLLIELFVEQRYFLAEILKNSNLPSTTLLQIIRDTGVEPAWTQIALPTGRSVAACQNAYSALFQRSSSITGEPVHKRPRRPPSFGDPPPVTERFLQPRPVGFAPVNGPELISPTTDEMKPRKKRGRPSKEEHDRRVAEAEARGEIYPKPRKPKTPRPSMEGQGVETVEVLGVGAATAIMFTPNKTIYAPPTSPTSRKKVPDNDTIESATTPAGRVSHEEQRAAESAPAEPHMTEFGPRESVLPGARQRAVTTEATDIEMGSTETAASSASVLAEGVYGVQQSHPFSAFPIQEPQAQQIRMQEVRMQEAPSDEEHQSQQQEFPEGSGQIS
ncbi:hypothetical protein MMC18_005207 [Xylographa bjoerkii]|nr:hypothetical protein [Xylographa bjoerkii]